MCICIYIYIYIYARSLCRGASPSGKSTRVPSGAVLSSVRQRLAKLVECQVEVFLR